MQSAMYLKAYGFYKDGFWPRGQGWLEQPAKLLDAFAVIETELNHMAEDETSRQRRGR